MSESTLPILMGERVRLRPMTADDADAIFAIFSDPESMRYWAGEPYTERAQADDYLARRIAPSETGLMWAITLPEADTLLGTACVHNIDRANGHAELGYVLARTHWGKGLALEAGEQLIQHAFETLELRRLEAEVDPRNERSCRLLERLGFVREGYLRERWRVGSEISDSALYGLLAREWRTHDAP